MRRLLPFRKSSAIAPAVISEISNIVVGAFAFDAECGGLDFSCFFFCTVA